jgi:hypothetical protein
MVIMKSKIFLLFLMVALTAHSTDYYVSPSGSSGNSGLNAGAPWPLQYALNQTVAGMTLNLAPGLYSGQYFIDTHSGTAGNPITIRSTVKWGAVLANAAGDGLQLYQANYIVVDGLCISNSIGFGAAGILLEGHFGSISNCWIVSTDGIGIASTTYTGAYACSNSIFDRNLVELSGHGVWDTVVGHRWHGMYISGPNNIIRNNVVRNNAGYGIHYYTGYSGNHQDNTFIYGNLTYGNTNFYAIACYNDNESLNGAGTNYVFGNTAIGGMEIAYGAVLVTNNIITPPVSRPLYNIANYTPQPAKLTNDYNMSTVTFTNDSLVRVGPHDVVTNYLGFVNTNSGKFWLKSDSPARGTAKTTVYGPVNFFGNAQSSVSDIGAFQYSSVYAADTRTLDPSGDTGANYWLILGTPPIPGNIFTTGTVRFGH